MKFLIPILLAFCLSAEAQVYSITVDTVTCRISATSGQKNYHFVAGYCRYIDRNQNLIIFDDRRSVGVSNQMVSNYPTLDSLKADLDRWFVSCLGGAASSPCDTTTITVSGVVTNESVLGANDGAIDISHSGGAGPYSYAWADGPTSEDRTGLAPGTYTVTVSDVNACPSVATPFTVLAGAAPALFGNAKSITFNGTSENVIVPDDNDLSMIEGGADIPFSIAAWVKASDWSNFAVLSKYPSTANQREWVLYATSSDLLRLVEYDASAGALISAQTTTSLTQYQNKWVHVVGTYDPAGSPKNVLYFNGVNQPFTTPGSGSFTAMENKTATVNTGEFINIFGEGEVDQVCLFRNVKLTQAEIYELMTIRDITQYSLYDSLVLYQEFDNDTTTAGGITDLSLAGNDGTMNGPYESITTCIPYPYTYQLDSTATVSAITPMQSDSNESFGGFAWDMDGVDEYIQVFDNNLLSRGNGTTDEVFSGTAWIKTSDCTAFPIVSKANEYLFWINASDKLEVRFIDASTGGYIGRVFNTALTSCESDWIKVGYSYDGSGDVSGIDLYINDEAVDDIDASSGAYTAMENTASNLTIGTDGSNYAEGLTTDVILYSSDLINIVWNSHEPRDETKTALSSDLIMYLRGYNSLNGANNVLDQSGNSLDGTMTSMEATDIIYAYPREVFDGANVGSFTMNGTTQRVDVADADGLSFTNDSMYISSYVNMTDATSFPIIYKEDEYLLWSNGADKLEARFIDSTTGGYIGRIYNTAITSSEGSWLFVEATFNGTNVDIRLDGVTVDDTDANSGSFTQMRNTANGVSIAYDGTNYAGGYFSHTTIGGVPVDICKSQEAYNDGSPIKVSASTFGGTLVSSWKMNQSDGATVTDIIGSNDGTSVGSPTVTTINYPTN